MTNKEIENPAVSVIDEAAKKFYQGFDDMPNPIRKKLSCEMMHNVFKYMAIQAIDEARRLDRKASIESIGLRESHANILKVMTFDHDKGWGEISSGMTQDFKTGSNSFNVKFDDGSENTITFKVDEG